MIPYSSVDQWKKIDPPIPVTVMGIDMTDIRVADNEDFGFGQAVITVRNDHTGAVYIAPRVMVMDGKGIIDSASIGRELVYPGESRSFTADVAAPKATMRDPAGFNLYVSFELSEPDSMSIAGLHGPYVKHFIAGSNELNKALRNRNEYSIPRSGFLGGEGNPSLPR